MCLTTRYNVSASTTLELLNRLAKVFKDYCGVLTEEAIRKNFILIYELLDEMIDFGYPQTTSTELLKQHVHNEPVLVQAQKPSVRLPTASRTVPSSSVQKPISLATGRGGKQKNEIFVDILERLNVLFNPNGYVVNSTIDGCIQMKSYLSGNPELRLALNEDLVIGKGGSYGSVVLDDVNFHECIRLDEFESSRMLSFVPPDGEFTALNYRITGEFRVPFRIFPAVEEITPYRLDFVIMVRAEIPEANHGANVSIRIPMPRAAVNANCELMPGKEGQAAEFNSSKREVLWSIRKFPGMSEISMRVKITLDTPVTAQTKRELGPVSMSFEIPMYNVSNLQVRYLRISEQHKSYNPYRWVRYVTQSNSYVCRL